jgi:hypothetical protein
MQSHIEFRDAFISYASADQGIAMDVVNRLENAGVSCWIAPRDIVPGVMYADALYYAIQAAPLFIVLMSKVANNSRHIARELEIAQQMHKAVVPLRIEVFESTGAFCYYTRAEQFFPWLTEPDLAVTKIAQAAERMTEARKREAERRQR